MTLIQCPKEQYPYYKDPRIRYPQFSERPKSQNKDSHHQTLSRTMKAALKKEVFRGCLGFQGLGLWALGLLSSGFRVHSFMVSGFRVVGVRLQSSGFRAQSSGFRVQDLFRVEGLGFRVQGLGPMSAPQSSKMGMFEPLVHNRTAKKHICLCILSCTAGFRLR